MSYQQLFFVCFSFFFFSSKKLQLFPNKLNFTLASNHFKPNRNVSLILSKSFTPVKHNNEATDIDHG